MVLDIIFSLDSVITAVGMADDIEVMVTAVIIAIGVMLLFAKQIGDFVNKYPSMKILGPVVPPADRRSADRRRASASTSTRATSTSRWRSALMVELLNIRFRTKQEPT